MLIRQTVDFYFFPPLTAFRPHNTPNLGFPFLSPPPGSRLLASLSTHLHTHPPTPSERPRVIARSPRAQPCKAEFNVFGKLLRRENAAQFSLFLCFFPRACTVYFTIRVLFRTLGKVFHERATCSSTAPRPFFAHFSMFFWLQRFGNLNPLSAPPTLPTLLAPPVDQLWAGMYPCITLIPEKECELAAVQNWLLTFARRSKSVP